MGIKSFISPTRLVVVAFMVMGIIAFNLSRPPLKNDLLTTFNEWYQTAATQLQSHGESQPSNLSVRISITVSNPALSATPTVWNLPVRTLLDPDDRDNTARALQLINESGVFGFSPLKNPSDTQGSITISVRDEQRQFEISIPSKDAEKNIQLRNLLKLLEVYSQEPPTTHVEPARL